MGMCFSGCGVQNTVDECADVSIADDATTDMLPASNRQV